MIFAEKAKIHAKNSFTYVCFPPTMNAAET